MRTACSGELFRMSNNEYFHQEVVNARDEWLCTMAFLEIAHEIYEREVLLCLL